MTNQIPWFIVPYTGPSDPEKKNAAMHEDVKRVNRKRTIAEEKLLEMQINRIKNDPLYGLEDDEDL